METAGLSHSIVVLMEGVGRGWGVVFGPGGWGDRVSEMGSRCPYRVNGCGERKIEALNIREGCVCVCVCIDWIADSHLSPPLTFLSPTQF